LSESEALEVALPYLNLTLLRQAIETYNSSKPESPPRSPPGLTLKDFNKPLPLHPTSWKISLEFGEDQENGAPDVLEPGAGDTNDDALTHSGFKPLGTTDRESKKPGNGVVALEAGLGSNQDNDDILVPAVFDQLSPAHETPSSHLKISTRVKETNGTSSMASPSRSTISSSHYSTEGDSTFLLDSLRSVFSSATALGSSFLMKDRESRSSLGKEPSGGVNVGGVDLEALRECYEMMIELKPRTIFAIQVTSSIEILLARMELELELAGERKAWSEEEMRAIIILLMVSTIQVGYFGRCTP